MDERVDFTYNPNEFAGLPEYVASQTSKGQRFITIVDPAIMVEKPGYKTHEEAMKYDVYIKWPNSSVVPPDDYDQLGDVMMGYVSQVLYNK